MSRTYSPSMYGQNTANPYQPAPPLVDGPKFLKVTGVNGGDVSGPVTASPAVRASLTPVGGEIGTNLGPQSLPSMALQFTGNAPDPNSYLPTGSGVVVSGLTWLYTADGAMVPATAHTAGSLNALAPRPAGMP